LDAFGVVHGVSGASLDYLSIIGHPGRGVKGGVSQESGCVERFPALSTTNLNFVPFGDLITMFASSVQSFPQIVTFSNTESPDLVNTGFDGTGQFAILG